MRVSTMLSVLSLSFLLGGCFAKYTDAQDAPDAPDATKDEVSTADAPDGSVATQDTQETRAPFKVCNGVCLDFEDGDDDAPFVADGGCAVTSSNASSGKRSLKCEGGGLVLEQDIKSTTFTFDAFVDGPTATTEGWFDFGSIRLWSNETWVDLEYRVTFEVGQRGTIEFLIDSAGLTKTLSFPTNLPLGKWHHFEIHYDRTADGIVVQAKADGTSVVKDRHVPSDEPLEGAQLSIFGDSAPYAVVFDEVVIR